MVEIAGRITSAFKLLLLLVSKMYFMFATVFQGTQEF